MEEEKDTAKKLDMLLYLRLAFGRYPPQASGAGSFHPISGTDDSCSCWTRSQKKGPLDPQASDHPDTKKMPTQKSDFHHFAK